MKHVDSMLDRAIVGLYWAPLPDKMKCQFLGRMAQMLRQLLLILIDSPQFLSWLIEYPCSDQYWCLSSLVTYGIHAHTRHVWVGCETLGQVDA